MRTHYYNIYVYLYINYNNIYRKITILFDRLKKKKKTQDVILFYDVFLSLLHHHYSHYTSLSSINIVKIVTILQYYRKCINQDRYLKFKIYIFI